MSYGSNLAKSSVCGLVFLSSIAVAMPGAKLLSRQIGQDYAFAACLTLQSAPLRDEGYSLASLVLGRSGVSPLSLGSIDAAVKHELAHRPMTTVHVDAPVDQSDKPAPLAHCLAISRAVQIQTAIARINKSR